MAAPALQIVSPNPEMTLEEYAFDEACKLESLEEFISTLVTKAWGKGAAKGRADFLQRFIQNYERDHKVKNMEFAARFGVTEGHASNMKSGGKNIGGDTIELVWKFCREQTNGGSDLEDFVGHEGYRSSMCFIKTCLASHGLEPDSSISLHGFWFLDLKSRSAEWKKATLGNDRSSLNRVLAQFRAEVFRLSKRFAYADTSLHVEQFRTVEDLHALTEEWNRAYCLTYYFLEPSLFSET